MAQNNELQRNLQYMVDAKILNLEVSLSTIVRGGSVSDIDPWDVFCGNGWILRRRGPGPIVFGEAQLVRDVVRQELKIAEVELSATEQ